MSAPTAGLLVGRRLGGYEVYDLLDRRRSVETYRAKQVAMDRMTDLTVLPPHAAHKPSAAEGFERSLSVVGRLHHDNVISALDAGVIDGWRYFATERAQGPTLEEVLAAGGPMPMSRAVEIALAVARALEHLEQVGVVHRGLNPSTIVLSDAGPVKLAGFLVAKTRSPGGAETWFDADTSEAPYVSPERLRGEKGLDTRADAYSLGCVLYRLIAGRTPFHGLSAASIFDAHLNRRPRDPRTLLADLPPGLVHVLDRCLRKHADHRYEKVADLVVDLTAVQAGRTPPTPDPHRLLWPSRNVQPSKFRLQRSQGETPTGEIPS